MSGRRTVRRSAPWSNARPAWSKLIHLERGDSISLHRALLRDLAGLPPHVLRSITWEQGTEMAAHEKIAADLGVKVYFCDPCSPWQRPSNENANGVLRDYFPKSADFHSTPEQSCCASRTSSTADPEQSSDTAHQPTSSQDC